MMATWRFFPGILRFFILSVCLWSCKGETTTGPQSRCTTHDLTGAVDIVFVMDRSKSVNKANFENMHTFVKNILEKHTTVSPDHARVAVISFGSNVTTDVDYISRDKPVYECEFFHKSGAFNTQVSFVVGGSRSTTKPRNEEILEALEASRIILEAGRNERQNVELRQFMWIMTDYHGLADSAPGELEEITTTLKDSEQVILFGHGDGNDHNDNDSEALQKVVSQPPQCYYDNQRTVSQLKGELQWEFRPITPENIQPGEWRDVTDPKICQETTGCSSCTCKEFGEVIYDSTYQCMSSDDKNGTDGHLWNTLKYVLFGVGGLAVLVLIISLISYCCCCGKTTSSSEQEAPKEEEETRDQEEEPEGDIDNHYQNSIVVDIWNQATLDRQTRIEESDSPPTSPDYLEPISAPPSPQAPTPRITHQYLTQRREGNPQTRGEYVDSNNSPRVLQPPPPSANGHCRPGRVSNPSYGGESPSVQQGSSFLEEFQKKWQQIRKTVVSTVRFKPNGKRDRQYENEGTIDDISRRFHDNSRNGSTNQQTGTSDEPTRGNNSQSESRRSGWSFWPFRRSTSQDYENEDTIEDISRRHHEQNGSAVQEGAASGDSSSRGNNNSQSESRKSGWSLWPFRKSTAQQYENEEAIEQIRQNKKSQDGKNTKRGASSFKRLLRTFERNTNVEKPPEESPDVFTIQTPTPDPVSPGLLSPNRAPYLELI